MFVLCCCYSVLLNLGLCMDILSYFFVRKSDYKASNWWKFWLVSVETNGISVVNESVYENLTFGVIFWLDINWIQSYALISCLSLAICENNNHSMPSQFLLPFWQQKNIPIPYALPSRQEGHGENAFILC